MILESAVAVVRTRFECGTCRAGHVYGPLLPSSVLLCLSSPVGLRHIAAPPPPLFVCFLICFRILFVFVEFLVFLRKGSLPVGFHSLRSGLSMCKRTLPNLAVIVDGNSIHFLRRVGGTAGSMFLSQFSTLFSPFFFLLFFLLFFLAETRFCRQTTSHPIQQHCTCLHLVTAK